MKNIPKKIYLQVGDHIPNDIEFKDLSLDAVTWSIDKQNKSDICYVLEAEIKELIELIKWYNPDLSEEDAVEVVDYFNDMKK